MKVETVKGQRNKKRLVILLFALVVMSGLQAQGIKKIKITDLEKTMMESTGPTIISFWATFCIPCLEEIPYFQEEIAKYKQDSIQYLLVSLDLEDHFPKKIEAVVKKNKITAPVVWLDEYNADYFCPKVDPKWSGAIPATLFINNKKGYRKFYEDQVSHDQLKKEIMAIL
jgi:thiol-disulfide isomerase/thioredoxin